MGRGGFVVVPGPPKHCQKIRGESGKKNVFFSKSILGLVPLLGGAGREVMWGRTLRGGKLRVVVGTGRRGGGGVRPGGW